MVYLIDHIALFQQCCIVAKLRRRKYITRSTGTVHTSAKACLTSVMIQICDLDSHQNLIICSLAHCQPSLKISCKSVSKFLHKVANRQTDNSDYIASLMGVTILRRLHNWWLSVVYSYFLFNWPRNYSDLSWISQKEKAYLEDLFSRFVQAECPSCHRTSNVKTLTGTCI